MSSVLEDFFLTGQWSAACEDQPREAWTSSLETPWKALSLLWDPKRRTALKNEGFSPSEITPFLESARDAVLDDLARVRAVTPYEAAMWRLLVRSLLDPAGSAMFPIGDEKQRREWLRSASDPAHEGGSRLDFVASIDHPMLLRIAVNRGSLAARDPADRRDLALAILHAAGNAAGERHATQGLRLLLAAVRVWVLSNEGEDLDDRPELVIGAFGHSVETIRQVVAAMSTGRVGAAELLVESGNLDPDGIESQPLASDSAGFYGVIVDVDFMAAVRQIEASLKTAGDPWVAAVFIGMLADAEAGRRVMMGHPGVAAGELARGEAIDILLGRAFPRMSEADLAGPLGEDPALAITSIYDRVFRAGFEHALVSGIDSTRSVLSQFGLVTWFDTRIMAVKAGGEQGVGISPDDATRAGLVGLESSLASSGLLGSLAGELSEDASGAARGEESRRAERAGRAWLHALVSSLVRNGGDGLDRTALTGEDLGVLQRLAEACREGEGEWWRIELDPPRRLRFIEASVHTTGADLELLREAASEVAGILSGSAPVDDVDRFRQELDRCRESLVTGTLSVRPKMLEAFRRGDEVAFLEIFETPSIEIARPGHRVRVLDGRAWILIGLIILPLAWMTARWVIPSGSARGLVPNEATQQAGRGGPPSLLPSAAGWNLLPGDRQRWFVVLDRDQVREFLGDRLALPGNGGRAAQIPRDQAKELLRRFRLAIQARFLGGVKTRDGGVIRWDQLQVRMPRKLDEAELRRSRAGVPGTFWLEDGSMAAPAVVTDGDKASAVVVIDERI